MTVWFRYSTNVEESDQPESDDRPRVGSPVISAAMLQFYLIKYTGPHSAVGYVSGNRWESDCRSRGREFDPSPVPYFRGV